MNKPKKILLISHIANSIGPVQKMEEFLIQKKSCFAVIGHPYEFTSNESFLKIYSNGKIISEKKIIRKKKLSAIAYIEDIFLSIRIYKKYLDSNFELCFGFDPLNAISAIIIKKIYRINKVIYYSVDYAEKRFENFFLNYIYHLLDKFASRHADYCWSVSNSIRNIRKHLRIPDKKNILAPNGLNINEICTTPEFPKNNIFYIGVLSKTKGVHSLIDIMPQILKQNPLVKLHIIGGGPDEEFLQTLAQKKGISDRINFYGYTKQERTNKILSLGGIGVAPYEDTEDYVRFCDPLKVKNYLAMGIPVVMTKIPALAEEIEENSLGFAVENKKEMADRINEILSDSNKYMLFRNNALKAKKMYDINMIYDQAFQKISYNI
ncbi:MAG: glycosyltransferase [Patescibacteria group bacterium]|jgi:glycosyltransferase involved in cell wall biosynthesis